MDGAQVCYLYPAAGAPGMLPRVGGRGGRGKVLAVMRNGTPSSADLGGSSKYSNENFED
jgi:hypothetical protein